MTGVIVPPPPAADPSPSALLSEAESSAHAALVALRRAATSLETSPHSVLAMFVREGSRQLECFLLHIRSLRQRAAQHEQIDAKAARHA